VSVGRGCTAGGATAKSRAMPASAGGSCGVEDTSLASEDSGDNAGEVVWSGVDDSSLAVVVVTGMLGAQMPVDAAGNGWNCCSCNWRCI